MQKSPKLVEPKAQPFTPQEDATSRLTGRGGLSATDARWVAELLLSAGVLPPPETPEEPLSGIREHVVTRACEELDRPDRDLAMVLLLLFVDLTQSVGGSLKHNGSPWTMTTEAATRFLEVLRVHKLPVQRAVLSLWSVLAQPTELARCLRSKGLFDPIAALDLDVIRRYGDEPSEAPQPTTPSDPQFAQACNLPFWLRHLGLEVLPGLLPFLNTADESDTARLAQGIARAVSEHANSELRLNQPWFDALPPEHISVLRPIFDELDSRMRRTKDPSPLLRRAWTRWALLTLAATPAPIPQDLCPRLLSAATEELGRMRSPFRRLPEDQAAAEFKALSDPYTVALNILFRYGTLWQGLKPLLLLLRALPVPSVGADLRPWHESGLPAPPPVWHTIADDFAGYLHRFAKPEQSVDPELTDVRANFANYCLDRLKTRESHKPEYAPPGALGRRVPVEEDPVWRRCLVRAVRELRINPWGRGHRVLFQCMNNDPDPDVRDDARIGYGELRHNPELEEGMSPRAAIVAAHWWLRQAQRASIAGADAIDARGAQRTHDKETQRAKEQERAQPVAASATHR